MRIVETMQKTDWPAIFSRVTGAALLLAGVLLAAGLYAANPQANSVFNIFDSHSTPADSIRRLSFFVLGVTGLIFLVVFSLLSYAIVKFRQFCLHCSRWIRNEYELLSSAGEAQISNATCCVWLWARPVVPTA